MTSRGADLLPDATPDAEPEPATPDADAGRATTRLKVVAALAAFAALVWIVVVLLTVGHGFADSDEGFYLLTYRWWREGGPNFTGAQYFYGPVFDLLGHNVVALRVFRLFTVVATHAAFGWAFMSWLRTRRPSAPATRWWEIAGTMILVVCGGMVYSWLPLSAGYNDISTLGGLLVGAVVLRLAADVERGDRIPAWVPAMLGPLAVVIGLAKWSSAVATFAVIGLVGVTVVRRRSWREVGRMVAWALGGAVITLAVAQLVLAPLFSAFIAIAKYNRHITAASVSPTGLIEFYLDQVKVFGKAAIKANVVLLFAAVVAPLARGRYWRWVGLGLVVIGLAVSLRRILVDQWWDGGGLHGTRYTIATIGLLLVPATVGVAALVRDRVGALVSGTAASGSSLTRPGARSWMVLAMLVLLPITQAFGSGTGLLGMAIDSVAAWVAVLIAIATGLEAAPLAARWLAGVITAGVAVMTTVIAVTGLWVHPYLTPGRAETTAAVTGVPALSGIHLDPKTAREYTQLYDQLRPFIEPPGRAIMAFDQIAGIVLLLDGRPLGEAWTGAGDPERTAFSMRQECQQPNRWWGNRAPILLFNRPVTDVEKTTLAICGYNFATDYRLLAPKDQTHGLDVYVPIAG